MIRNKNQNRIRKGDGKIIRNKIRIRKRNDKMNNIGNGYMTDGNKNRIGAGSGI